MGDLSDKMSEQDGITSMGSQIYNSPDPQPAEIPWRPLEPGEEAGPDDLLIITGWMTRRPLPSAPPSTEIPVGQISDEELKRATPQCWTEKHTREDGTFDEDKYAEGFNQCVEPAPAQTAREWVDANDNPETGDLPASKAIELADRADRAEAAWNAEKRAHLIMCERFGNLQDDYATCLEELNTARRLAIKRLAERDKLRDRVKELEAETELLRETVLDWSQRAIAEEGRCDALKAERVRLREALALEETNAAHWRGKYEALNQTTNEK